VGAIFFFGTLEIYNGRKESLCLISSKYVKTANPHIATFTFLKMAATAELYFRHLTFVTVGTVETVEVQIHA